MSVGKFNSLIEKWRNSTGQSKAIQTRHDSSNVWSDTIDWWVPHTFFTQWLTQCYDLIWIMIHCGSQMPSPATLLSLPGPWKCPCSFWLPPELLASIFLEYAQSYEDKFYYNFTQVSPWVAISYVCWYGCNVALNSACIWAHLFIVSPQWMDELLRRLKFAPLIVRVDFNMFHRDSSTIHSSLEKILENMECIQDLWID